MITDTQRAVARSRMSRLPRLSALTLEEAQRTTQLLERHDRATYDNERDDNSELTMLPVDHPDIENLDYPTRLTAAVLEYVHYCEQGFYLNSRYLGYKWLPEGDRTWERLDLDDVATRLEDEHPSLFRTDPNGEVRPFYLDTDSPRFKAVQAVVEPPSELRRNALEASHTELAICEVLYRYRAVGDAAMTQSSINDILRGPYGYSDVDDYGTNEVLRRAILGGEALQDLISQAGLVPRRSFDHSDPNQMLTADNVMARECQRDDMYVDNEFMTKVRPIVHKHVMNEFNKGYMLVGIRGMGGVPWDGHGRDRGPDSVHGRFENGMWCQVPRVTATGPVRDDAYLTGAAAWSETVYPDDFARSGQSERELDINRIRIMFSDRSELLDQLDEWYHMSTPDEMSLDERLAEYVERLGGASTHVDPSYRVALVPEVSEATLRRALSRPAGDRLNTAVIERDERDSMLDAALFELVTSSSFDGEETLLHDAAASAGGVSPGNQAWPHFDVAELRRRVSARGEAIPSSGDARETFVPGLGTVPGVYEDFVKTTHSQTARWSLESSLGITPQVMQEAERYIDDLAQKYPVMKPLFEPYRVPPRAQTDLGLDGPALESQKDAAGMSL